jgi:hypothetical protein
MKNGQSEHVALLRAVFGDAASVPHHSFIHMERIQHAFRAMEGPAYGGEIPLPLDLCGQLGARLVAFRGVAGNRSVDLELIGYGPPGAHGATVTAEAAWTRRYQAVTTHDVDEILTAHEARWMLPGPSGWLGMLLSSRGRTVVLVDDAQALRVAGLPHSLRWATVPAGTWWRLLRGCNADLVCEVLQLVDDMELRNWQQTAQKIGAIVLSTRGKAWS